MMLSEARKFVIKFRPHEGKTIDEIASTDRGLLWLDSIVDASWLWEDAKLAITVYLSDPTIQKEIQALL